MEKKTIIYENGNNRKNKKIKIKMLNKKKIKLKTKNQQIIEIEVTKESIINP